MRLFVFFLGLVAATFGAASEARADSYWDHNGSLMRLVSDGQGRAFYYEDPRPGLAVRRGTLLFNGRREGGRYVGTARVFSKYCSQPLEYRVEGYVARGGAAVILTGRRPVHRRCRPTGAYKTDRLVFTYSHTH